MRAKGTRERSGVTKDIIKDKKVHWDTMYTDAQPSRLGAGGGRGPDDRKSER